MNSPAVYSRQLTLVDLLDRLIDKGVVVHGDLMVSIAGVDLIYIGLRLLVSPVDYLWKKAPPAPSRAAADPASDPRA